MRRIEGVDREGIEIKLGPMVWAVGTGRIARPSDGAKRSAKIVHGAVVAGNYSGVGGLGES